MLFRSLLTIHLIILQVTTSFIDHFLVSEVAFDCISSGDILDSGPNLSNHLTAVIKLTAKMYSNRNSYTNLPTPPKDTFKTLHGG